MLYVVVCKIYQFLVTSTVPFSVFVMVVIAFDRYLCIIHPFKRMTSMTLKRVKAIVAWLFFLAFTLGLLCCLMYGTVRQVTFVKTNNFLLEISSSNETSQYGKVADQVHPNATLERVSIKIVNTGYCHADNIIFDLSFRAVYIKRFILHFLPFVLWSLMYNIPYRAHPPETTHQDRCHVFNSGCNLHCRFHARVANGSSGYNLQCGYILSLFYIQCG